MGNRLRVGCGAFFRLLLGLFLALGLAVLMFVVGWGCFEFVCLWLLLVLFGALLLCGFWIVVDCVFLFCLGLWC